MQKLNYILLNETEMITENIKYITESIGNINITLLSSNELKKIKAIYLSILENKLNTDQKITLKTLSFKYKKYE